MMPATPCDMICMHATKPAFGNSAISVCFFGKTCDMAHLFCPFRLFMAFFVIWRTRCLVVQSRHAKKHAVSGKCRLS